MPVIGSTLIISPVIKFLRYLIFTAFLKYFLCYKMALIGDFSGLELENRAYIMSKIELRLTESEFISELYSDIPELFIEDMHELLGVPYTKNIVCNKEVN